MTARRGFRTYIGLLLPLFGLVFQSLAAGQASSQPATAPAVTSTNEPISQSTNISVAIPNDAPAAPPELTPVRRINLLDCLTPPLSDTTVTWIAITVILVLTLQTRPFFSWRSMDGFVLALTALAFPLRNMNVQIANDPSGRSLQWWSYLLLSLGAGYWLIRGLAAARARSLSVFEPNVAGSAKMVLIIAVLYVALSQIMTAPLSAGSADGLAGGSYLNATGRLPYGEVAERDARSPLLYGIHAGACRLLGPVYAPTLNAVEPGALPAQRMLSTGEDLQGARLVNAVLFVLTFLGLGILGNQLHSGTVGLTLAALFAIFPGVLDSLAHPEAMLPACLITWSLVSANVPVIGSLPAVLLSFLAGLAWPWAFLLTGVMYLYLLRRRWQWPGATLGLLAGFASIILLVTHHVVPALPRADGALAASGSGTHYSASARENALVIRDAPSPAAASASWTAWIWSTLLRADDISLAACAPDLGSLDISTTTPPANIRIRDILPTDAAAAAQLQRAYRMAAAREPHPTQFCLATRTMLESTWLASNAEPEAVKSSWELWAGDTPATVWTFVRRGAKLLVALVAMVCALFVVGATRVRPHQLVGAFAAISAAALLAAPAGATLHWVLLAPAALALIAAGRVELERGEPAVDPDDVRGVPLSVGPRITIEK